MKRVLKFVIGAIIVLVVIGGAVYAYARLGFIDMRADIQPSAFEVNQATSVMDAATTRHAPKLTNPYQPTDTNLLQGMKLYREHCAFCHGAPDHPEKSFGHPLYPPAPQFMEDAPDKPDNENFYIAQNGVRWTGMPAWGKTLSDEELWKVVTFLGHMGKLPPPVAKVWQNTGGPGTGARTTPVPPAPHRPER